jgi:aryl-alcohol dehydrogenase-like predicted oxidoreductase
VSTVPLGRSALQIPRVALGAGCFGREIDEAASWELLDYAASRGLNLIDTAESYGGGNSREYRRRVYGIDDEREVSGEMHSSEKIIGRWMQARKNRREIVLCTKFISGGTAAHVRDSLRGSLERLQTDYVDIYMLHTPFVKVPIRETLEALTVEVKAGRIRTIGCSNFSADRLREANETAERHGLVRMDSTEPPFSLADAAARDELLPYCLEQQVSSIVYSPLAAGFLTGKYAKGQPIPKGTRFDIVPGHIDVYFSDRNFHVVSRLRALGEELGVPVARLAMAWVFRQAGVASVLVGARKQSHLENALEAFEYALDPAVEKRMTEWLYEAFDGQPRQGRLRGAIHKFDAR